MSPHRILLLTNRDSDNVGDQIIEATVISIVNGVMKNLGFTSDEFSISSRAAGIISRKYMKTEDPELLKSAREAISGSDLIVFGGAPLFNYAYQNFYRRTIITLELAQEYGVPVLFSSIGVEKFDAENEKSQALKQALELPVIRQITTRDDLESLRLYTENTDTPVALVSDPAVLADIVYREERKPTHDKKLLLSISVMAKRKLGRIVHRVLRGSRARPVASPKNAQSVSSRKDTDVVSARTASSLTSTSASASIGKKQKKKRIGLVVTRAGIFADNGISFTEADQRQFWLDTIKKLDERGYDYRLFTTGHFSDEVFLDRLIKNHGVPGGKAAVTINSPDELIGELRNCDGIIAYRLHASITAYAFSIPSIGLSWNFKVPYFYDSVGYGERAIEPDRWTAEEVVPALEQAMIEGVEKKSEFLKSVYDTLFFGIAGVYAPDTTMSPFTFEELKDGLPRQVATSPKAYRDKVNRKLRRTYENYQKKGPSKPKVL